MRRHALLFLLLASILASGAYAQFPIPPDFYSQNAWYSFYNSSNPSGDPYTNQSQTNVKNSGARLIRIGGNDFNLLNSPPITKAKIVELIDRIRADGMEPILSVRFPNVGNNNANVVADAAAAGALVESINTTTGPDGSTYYRKVDKWVIANEPDQCIVCPSGVQQGYDYIAPADIPKIAEYVRHFAIQMKKKDQNIKIIGPELSSYIDGHYTALFVDGNGLNDDISGLIPATFNSQSTAPATNLPFIDYISVHIYPNGFSSGTPAAHTNALKNQLIIPETTAGSLRWQLLRLKTKAATINANTLRTYFPIGIMVDETNVCYGNENNIGASALWNGNDNRSFIGGQWWADWMSVMLQYKVDVTAFWSAFEDRNGYVDALGNRRSAYWHFQAMAQNFKSILYTPSAFSGAPTNEIKTFAAKPGDRIAVMILNEGGNDYDFSVDLNGAASGGTGAVKITFPGIGSATPPVFLGNNTNLALSTAKIEKNSSVLLIYDCRGYIVSRTDYRLSGINANISNTNAYTPPSWTFPPNVLIGSTITHNIPASPNLCASNGDCGTYQYFPNTYMYSWTRLNPSGTPVFSGNSITLCSLNAGSTTTYQFTATDPTTGCSTTQNVVVVDCGPIVGFDFYAYVCGTTPSSCGANNGAASACAGGASTFSYKWDGGPYVTSSTISGLSPGLHTVIVKAAPPIPSGPTKTLIFNVPIAGAQPALSAGPDKVSRRYCKVTLSASPNLTSSGHTYAWYKGSSTTPFSNANTVTFAPWSTDIYTVKVTSPSGCTNTDQVKVSVISPMCAPFLRWRWWRCQPKRMR
jgi:hypothetical protein